MRFPNLLICKSVVGFLILLVGVFFYSCSKNNSPVEVADHTGTVKVKMSDSLVGAKVVLAQGNEIGSFDITDMGTIIEFADLEPGNYELKIVMPDGNEFVKSVDVEEGKINYVGEITVVTSSAQGGQNINSEFVKAHSPKNGAEVIFNRPDKYHPEPTGRLSVAVQFSKPMDRKSIQQALKIKPAVEGYFVWNSYFTPVKRVQLNYDLFVAGAPTVESNSTYIPSAEITTYNNVNSFTYNFAYKDSYTDTTYKTTITTAAKDSSGEQVKEEYTFSFSTIQSAFSFDEITTNPRNGEDYVALMAPNGIKVTFPRRMDQKSVESNITVVPSGSYVYLWQDYNILIIYTGGQLLPETKYSISVDSSALDIEGSSLGTSYTSTFYTAPLYLKSSEPKNGQLGVSKIKDLKLTFNSYMDLNMVKDKITLVDGSGDTVSTTIQYHSYKPYNAEIVYYLDQIIIDPVSSLQPSIKYTLTIGIGAGDLLGGKTKEQYEIVFITMP